MIMRSVLEETRMISPGHHRQTREAIAFGVEILAEMPELLVELLVESGSYVGQAVHDLATCEADRCGPNCHRVLVPTDPPPGRAAAHPIRRDTT